MHCSNNCGITSLYFVSTLLTAFVSIFFVWLGRKYKVSYYNALLVGWLGWFGGILLTQWYDRHSVKY